MKKHGMPIHLLMVVGQIGRTGVAALGRVITQPKPFKQERVYVTILLPMQKVQIVLEIHLKINHATYIVLLRAAGLIGLIGARIVMETIRHYGQELCTEQERALILIRERMAYLVQEIVKKKRFALKQTVPGMAAGLTGLNAMRNAYQTQTIGYKGKGHILVLVTILQLNLADILVSVLHLRKVFAMLMIAREMVDGDRGLVGASIVASNTSPSRCILSIGR